MMNNNTLRMPTTWGDLYESETPIDFQAFLKSDILREKLDHDRIPVITRHVLGPISLVASTAIIWHLLRSHDALSTTYHRLVFGLCLADITSSFASSLSSSSVPREMNYFIPYAKGTETSCEVQGFLFVLGFGIASLYNCSLCFYYLAIIKYNKRDEYIRNKLEPWFHGISIMVPVFISVTHLSTHSFNTLRSVCLYGGEKPPHCIGYDDEVIIEGFSIPCGSGDLRHNPFLQLMMILAHIVVLALPPVVIISTMIPMYRAVLKVESKIRRYGVGSLRKSARSSVRRQRSSVQSSVNENASGVLSRLKTRFKSIVPCSTRNTTVSNRLKKKKTKKRIILDLAMGYSLAWFLTHAPYVMYLIHPSRLMSIVGILNSLQGVYNLFVYMNQKMRASGKTGKGYWHDFLKAWKSKGVKSENNSFSRRSYNGSKRRTLSAASRVPSSQIRAIKEEHDSSRRLNLECLEREESERTDLSSQRKLQIFQHHEDEKSNETINDEEHPHSVDEEESKKIVPVAFDDCSGDEEDEYSDAV